ncbi:MAG: hypothetical protein V4723_21805 [Pseudomonadota bacterium]
MHALIKLKDSVLLLLAGCLAAILAGLFWYQLGEVAFTVFNAFVIIALVLNNRALRAKVGKAQGKEP